MLTKEEFAKLTKAEKDQYIANATAIMKEQAVIAKEDSTIGKLSMADFEGKIKSMLTDLIKPMTAVDRKFFAFPGIGNPSDAVTPEAKFAKTKSFLKALVGGDVKLSRDMSQEVITKSNLSEGVAEAGGYLVPEEFKAEILRLAPLYGVIRQNSRMIPMKSDTLTIPAAGATSQSAIWTNEAGQILNTDPNFAQVTLTLKKLAAIPQVTNELLEDASVPVIQYLSGLIAEAFALAEDTQGFLGTGAPFVGVAESTGSPSRAVCASTINSLSYPDFVPVTGDLYTNAVAGSKFYLHRTVVAMMQAITTTTGAPLFPTMLREIFGFPIVPTEALHSVSTLGASSASVFGIFGNINKGYAMGEKGSIRMKISTEATVGSNNLFEKDMVALRATERVAMGVLLPSYWVKLKTG